MTECHGQNKYTRRKKKNSKNTYEGFLYVKDRLQKKTFVNEKTGLLDYTMEPVQKQSTLYRTIGVEALKGEKPGTFKSHAELFEMFNTNKNDLGASYFIID